MKLYLFLCLACFAPLLAQGQACHGTAEPDQAAEANQRFAHLADDADFQAQHLVPTAVDGWPMQGKMIEFPAEGGPDAKAYYVPAAGASQRYLFLIHEYWGLNAHIQQEAERLQADLGGAVHVLALDMYDGRVASTREEARSYMQAVEQQRAEAIVRGALAYAGADAQVASLGWCFGGGWSLQAALLAGPQAVGCVMYYGMPLDDVARLRQLGAEVLAIFATRDQWINAEVARRFRQNLVAARRPYELAYYDADHAFANPSNPRYQAEAAEAANARALRFLKAKFQLGQ